MAEQSRLTFYAPWPVFGKKFNKQLIAVRENFQSLSPLVRAATVDEETERVDDDLAGWALGEAGFRNKFRTYYDKTNNEFKIQKNIGTEAIPIWHDCLRIRESDCMITATNGLTAEGGFYNLQLPMNLTRTQEFESIPVWEFQHNLNTFPVIAQAVSDTGKVLTPTRIDVSDPNKTYFYFSAPQRGTAMVTADASLSEAFNPFYLTLTQTDPGSTIIKTQTGITMRFKSGDFYLAQIEGDIAEIRLDRSALGNGGAGSITFAESESGGFSDAATTLKFDSNFFYLSTGGDGNPVVSSTGGAGEANTASNLGDTTYGLFAQKSGVDLQFKSLTAGSNITLTASGTEVQIASSGSGSGGGFYGIVFDDGNTVFRDDELQFNSNEFYLTQDADGKPKLNLVASGFGEINTASNLGDTTNGLFAQKVGVDLQFKSLTAGSNITLTPSGTEVQISSSASGGGGGFYGILFKESEAGGYKERDDVLVFDSTFFYLTSDNSGKPIVSLSQSGSSFVQSFTSVVEVNVAHTFGHADLVWSVYSGKKAIIPMDAYVFSTGANFYFAKSTTGRVVLTG